MHVSTHSIFFFIGNTNEGGISYVWGLVLIASRRKNIDKTVSIAQNHSIKFPFLVAIRRHFENALFVSPRYEPRVSAGETPRRGEGRGSYFKISPQAHFYRLKDIKSIFAQSN